MYFISPQEVRRPIPASMASYSYIQICIVTKVSLFIYVYLFIFIFCAHLSEKAKQVWDVNCSRGETKYNTRSSKTNISYKILKTCWFGSLSCGILGSGGDERDRIRRERESLFTLNNKEASFLERSKNIIRFGSKNRRCSQKYTFSSGLDEYKLQVLCMSIVSDIIIIYIHYPSVCKMNLGETEVVVLSWTLLELAGGGTGGPNSI
jgi:hypothetical protein